MMYRFPLIDSTAHPAPLPPPLLFVQHSHSFRFNGFFRCHCRSQSLAFPSRFPPASYHFPQITNMEGMSSFALALLLLIFPTFPEEFARMECKAWAHHIAGCPPPPPLSWPANNPASSLFVVEPSFSHSHSLNIALLLLLLLLFVFSN